MVMKSKSTFRSLLVCALMCSLASQSTQECSGQSTEPGIEKQLVDAQQGIIEVKQRESRMEMIINSSNILEVSGDIARANVHNDAMVQVKPVSRNQMLYQPRQQVSRKWTCMDQREKSTTYKSQSWEMHAN